ncbi:MAG TPA: hypothetical protein VHB20_03325 [Verrucomicrobiae bacterium]|nr:hypothetical protein [Verrucomicrobiae bacterium]
MPKESTERTSGGPAFWPGLLLALAATSITVGILWDISWHTTIGRDTFWTPAHMAIYLGGTIGGCVGGWLAIQSTFFGEGRNAVTVLGARAPLGAWVAIWGAVAMLTSAPFDNWWHNAYGLDVRIISVPHALLGLGMLGISLGALLLTLSWQNQQQDGAGGGLFVYVGGVFVVLGAVFIMEYSWPNMQHTGRFFEVAALTFPFRLVTLGRAGRISWPATRSAAVFLLIYGLMIWILPLFPAEPKLAPIYNKLTHMVPPPFPVLLIFPALAMDLVLRRRVKDQGWGGWLTAMALGTVFLAVFIPVQWFFAEFLLSPGSHNWFFAGDRIWSYGSSPGSYRMEFWDWKSDPLNFKSAGWSWVWATASAWVGLRLGGWMRKVQR